MFHATRAVRFVKKTTGIVGLPPVENARAVLTGLYQQVLVDVQVRGRGGHHGRGGGATALCC